MDSERLIALGAFLFWLAVSVASVSGVVHFFIQIFILLSHITRGLKTGSTNIFLAYLYLTPIYVLKVFCFNVIVLI